MRKLVKKKVGKNTSITLLPPRQLHADIALPASKSLSNRALIMNALCKDGLPVHNLADCDDTQAMIRALTERPATIDIGAAGTAMRFLTAFLSVTPGCHILTGSARMRQRPIAILVETLCALGANITYFEEKEHVPLHITGASIKGGDAQMDGSVSSQFISALLMIGPVMADGLTLSLRGHIASRPYIEMTLALMRQFGAAADWTDERTIRVEPGGYKPTCYTVESDWSAASYWYEAVALTQDEAAEVVLQGLDKNSLQGDSAVSRLFAPLGVRTEFLTSAHGTNSVRLTRTGKHVTELEYDFAMQPDLAQTFVVCCAMLGVRFRFTGLESLRIKETDRIQALQTELRKLGYVVREPSAGILSWDGERCAAQEAVAIDTYDDHRMAMAFAPVALRRESLIIHHPEVVSKSYPRFWDDLATARFTIHDTPSEE